MRLSPDDRLLAFRSSFSGQKEIYLVDFPSFENRRLVSRGPVDQFEWHPEGSSVFYTSADYRTLNSVAIPTQGDAPATEPVEVLKIPTEISPRGFQVSKDGDRFLMLKNIPEPLGADGLPKPKALLMENWFEDFRETP